MSDLGPRTSIDSGPLSRPEPGPLPGPAPASTPRALRELGIASLAPGDVAILVALVRLIAAVSLLIGTLEVVAGISVEEPRAVVLGLAAVVYGLWVATRVASLAGNGREMAITRIAVVTLS